jgi:hypothetical protein
LTDASQSFVSLLRYPVGAATRLTEKVVALAIATPRLVERQVWVNGGHSDYVGGRSGVPEIADDLLHGTKSSSSGHFQTFSRC